MKFNEEEPLRPGSTVRRIVNGQMTVLQVVQDDGNKISVVDPKNPKQVDQIDRREIAPEDEEDGGLQPSGAPKLKPHGIVPTPGQYESRLVALLEGLPMAPATMKIRVRPVNSSGGLNVTVEGDENEALAGEIRSALVEAGVYFTRDGDDQPSIRKAAAQANSFEPVILDTLKALFPSHRVASKRSGSAWFWREWTLVLSTEARPRTPRAVPQRSYGPDFV